MSHELVAEYDNASGQGVVEVVSNHEREVCVTIGGETAYKGPYDGCETCAYLFEKVHSPQSLPEGAGQDDARKLTQLLKNLQQIPDEHTLATIGTLFAPGTYSIMLLRLAPRLVLPGDQSDYFAHEVVDTWGINRFSGVADSPLTPYYRLGTQAVGDVWYGGKRLGVVLGAPLYPPTEATMMDPKVVASYREDLRTNSARPAVLALGLVEDRGPADWHTQPTYTRHLIVTLYILDGHHKIAAAAQAALAVQFLIFLPHTLMGRDWRDYVERAVTFLQGIAVTR